MKAVVFGGSSGRRAMSGHVNHSYAAKAATITITRRRMRLNKRGDCIHIEGMKRLALLLVVIAAVVAQPALAFDPKRPLSNRITLLQAPAYDASELELQIARNVRDRLLGELRARGFDAADSKLTYDEAQRTGAEISGLYVEIAPSEVHAHSTGDVAVRTRNVGVDVAMLVSRVAAELRVYDGRSFALIAKRHISREDVRVVPTGIGVGSYRMSVWFALPFVQYARYRAAANLVVRDAAAEIESVTTR